MMCCLASNILTVAGWHSDQKWGWVFLGFLDFLLDLTSDTLKLYCKGI